MVDRSIGTLLSLLIVFALADRGWADRNDLLPATDFTLVPALTIKLEAAVYGLAWAPDSRLLAVSTRDAVQLYRVPEFTKEDVLESNQGQIAGLAWAPDAGSLAVAGQDGTIWIWTPTAFSKKLDERAWVFDLKWGTDVNLLVGVDLAGLAKIWDFAGFARASIELDGSGLAVSLSPDNQTFAVGTGGQGSSLTVYSISTLAMLWKRQDVPLTYTPPFGYGKDEINGVAYSPDGKYLATVSQDGRLSVRWSVSGLGVMSVQAHEGGLGGARKVSWSPDATQLATCGEDGRVNLIRFPNPTNRLELLDSEKAVWTVAFSPDGKWVAAGADDGSVYVWSAPVNAVVEPAVTKQKTPQPEVHHRRKIHRPPPRPRRGLHFVPHWPFLER
jgi:WD40 repeat protein